MSQNSEWNILMRLVRKTLVFSGNLLCACVVLASYTAIIL